MTPNIQRYISRCWGSPI